MTDTQSPFRLIQPSQQLYQTDEGEQAALRGINDENFGGMYGLLINQRARARANQDRYGDLLGSINAQQAALAREKLASDDAAEQMKFRSNLMQFGGAGASAVLSGLRLPGLQSGYTPEEASQSLITTDGLQRALTGGKAFNEQMQGAHHGAEAGYAVDPGQRLPSTAAAAQRATVTTGAPMDITLKGMDLAAARQKQAAEDGDGETRATAVVDPGTGASQVKFENRKRPELAIAAQEAYDDHARQMRRHQAQPTKFARPPPFVIPRGSTPLAAGTPTEGKPLTQQGQAPPLPADNRRPATGTRTGTNTSPNPPARTGPQSAPPITADQMNRAQAAVATRGRITGYEWTPDGGRVALYAKGKPLRVGD